MTASPIGSGSAATSRRVSGHLVDPLGIDGQAVDRRGRRAPGRARPRRRDRWPRESRRGARAGPPPTALARRSCRLPGPAASRRDASLASCASVRHRLKVITLLGSTQLIDGNDRTHGKSSQPCDGAPDLDRVDHRRDVVHPHHPRSRAGRPPATRPTEATARSPTARPVIVPRNPLRDVPIKHHTPQVGKSIEVPQDLEVVLARLAKADPGVDRRSARGECRWATAQSTRRARKS